VLEFRILGPLEVLADGEPVALPRKKQRALLALLLLHVGEVVSTDQLIEELWAGKPPPTARDALQNYVSQLRKALGQETIVTRDPGYVLQAAPEELDIGRFETLVREAREADGAAARAELLRQAISLWRGTPLADLAYEDFTGLEVARLEELRAVALGDLVDAELELGRSAELVPALEAAIADRPFDERPRGQLMLALYRSGRQADALEAYHQARRTLVDELGLDPSPALRELEQAMLRQDPVLEAPLAAPVVPEERRKTVTILFADVVESTELAEALDPEALRGVLDGYFAACRRAIERHGGTVEKFIGDAVMAVFGVPAAHEDDALRAVRAAVEMRGAVAALSAVLERDQGLRLDLRIGLNTGEVYVGDRGGAGLVTGSAVNLAKRLEQAAPSGSIMLGAGTLELVRDAVRVRAVKPRSKTALAAFRLLELDEGAPAIARYLEAPLVGRDAELERLLEAFEQAKAEPPSQVVTVVGEPGIGKTRLANELVARVGDEARVLTGRCVAYGEGATYLPLREMVESVELESALSGADDAELVAQRVLELVGLAEGTAPAGEGAWAVRRFCEALARERSLVLLFEDVHWAEPTLLDLVEQLAERATGPIFCLCVARPELLEERPGWAGGALTLEPLAEEESVELLASLPGGDQLTEETQQRIVAIAAGNPLFAEQLFAYVAERGELDEVPPSVEALLESRLDLLQPDERSLLQHAAVVGREFSHRAVAELAPAEAATLSTHLFELVRKGFVRPERGEEEAFRFHHVLVRDVAYNGLPKDDRARLHERYADWLGGEPDALDEIVGYHLEQAYRYHAELGPVDRRAKQLAADAGARLGTAGMRAFRSGDMPATANLLGRAAVLLPNGDHSRRTHLVDLGLTLDARNESQQAVEALTQAVEESVAAGDRSTEMWARMEREFVELRRQPKRTADDLLAAAREAIPVLESAGDHRGVGRALILFGWVKAARYCDNAARLKAVVRALDHYKAAGWSTSTCLGQISGSLLDGPTPVHAAIERVQTYLDREVTDQAGRAYMLTHVSVLMAMRQEFDAAWERLSSAHEILDDLGLGSPVLTYALPSRATIDLLAGRPEAAVNVSRQLCDELERSRNFSWLASFASLLAEALVEVGELDEALHWTTIAEEHAAADDLDAHMLWPPVRATVHVQRGQFALAEPLAREAVTLADRSDNLNRRARAYGVLAQVLDAMGNAAEASDALSRAARLYEEKGNAVGMAQIRFLQGDPAPAST
jgi:DNA-binding SARP family transcriptional activator